MPGLSLVPGGGGYSEVAARVDSTCSERGFHCFRPERKISAERLDFISGAERLSSRNNRTQANRNAAGNEMEPRKWHARRPPPLPPPAPRTPRRTPPRHPVPHPPPTARQRPFTPRWRPTPAAPSPSSPTPPGPASPPPAPPCSRWRPKAPPPGSRAPSPASRTPGPSPSPRPTAPARRQPQKPGSPASPATTPPAAPTVPPKTRRPAVPGRTALPRPSTPRPRPTPRPATPPCPARRRRSPAGRRPCRRRPRGRRPGRAGRRGRTGQRPGGATPHDEDAPADAGDEAGDAPDPALVTKLTEHLRQIKANADEAELDLATSGDLKTVLAGLDEIADQAAQARRALKAAIGGRKAPAVRPWRAAQQGPRSPGRAPGQGVHPARDPQGARPQLRGDRQRPGDPGQARRGRGGQREAAQVPPGRPAGRGRPRRRRHGRHGGRGRRGRREQDGNELAGAA